MIAVVLLPASVIADGPVRLRVGTIVEPKAALKVTPRVRAVEGRWSRPRNRKRHVPRHRRPTIVYERATAPIAPSEPTPPAPVPVKIDEGVSLELWRIYLDQASQGLGLGQLFISKIKEVALHLSKEKLWLGVWEKNQKAGLHSSIVH